MNEYRIVCINCGSSQSVGSLDVQPMLTAADILAQAKHNPGCDLNHAKRDVPRITAQRSVDGDIAITTYTINPGAWKDAEFEVL